MRFTRRQFLSTSAAAAAPMIVPASVFGQNAPSARLTMAFIGCVIVASGSAPMTAGCATVASGSRTCLDSSAMRCVVPPGPLF